MWEDQEEYAILVGLSLKEYWRLTPKQFKKYVDVYNKKEEDRQIEIDKSNYNLASYIYTAINNPKNFPRMPYSEKRKASIEPKRMSPEEMERNFRRSVIIAKNGDHS